MTDLNWSDFRIIRVRDKGGSITRTARLLGVDASTVSRCLAATKEVFGAVLIVRARPGDSQPVRSRDDSR